MQPSPQKSSPLSRFAAWYRARSRRAQIIIASIAGIVFISCCALGASAGNTATTDTNAGNQGANVSTTNHGSSTTMSAQATATHSAATATPKPTPTRVPATATPRPAPTAKPATPTPAPRYPAIGGNPYDYTLVNTGNILYTPASDVCNWLNCIPSFWQHTNGYVDLCNDGTYSHSGGVRGDCSYHQGENQPVYQP